MEFGIYNVMDVYLLNNMTNEMKNTALITKEESQMFPKTFTMRYFKHGEDTRDAWNEIYATEEVVENMQEQTRLFESLNHEANLVIDVQLPNGEIK